MENIQEVFNRMQENKKKQKDIRQAYKHSLESSAEYMEIVDKLKTLRERKKQIEAATKESFSGELTKLDDLKIDLESDSVVLSDLVLSDLVKGKTVEVVDQYDNKYEPIFKVNFKKE